MRNALKISVFQVLLLISVHCAAMDISAEDLVSSCWNYMRDKASESVVDMTIHRPDWQRTMTIRAWTRGQSESLFFITAPPRDKGNGTLKKGHEMWTYNPKINRVIKLPPSMMSQSWMGSDFSNNDLARSDSLLHDYVHTMEGAEIHQGKIVYIINSVPKPAAPVVWGMQQLKIREDFVLLEETFYDEDLQPVKIMVNTDIRPLGGKLYPRMCRMHKTDTPENYTLLEYRELKFLDSLPDRRFSLSALKHSGR